MDECFSCFSVCPYPSTIYFTTVRSFPSISYRMRSSPFKFTSLLRMLLAWKVVTGLCSFDWHLSSHETASSVSVSPSCTCSTRRSLDLGQLMPRRYGGWEGGSHGDFNVLPSGKRPRYWRSPTLPRWPSETIMVLVLGCSGRTFRFQILQMLFDWLSVFRSYLPVFAY